MEHTLMMLTAVVKTTGLFAPAFFILLHLLRQILFIPVAAVCIIGGILFGAVYGTIYSIIGITLMSSAFYLVIQCIPSIANKISSLKQKWFGRYSRLSLGQLIILRLLPFVHFHLLSFCIFEAAESFKEYLRVSFYTNIPLAALYTIFGHSIQHLSAFEALLAFVFLGLSFFLVRQKEMVFKWKEFFEGA